MLASNNHRLHFLYDLYKVIAYGVGFKTPNWFVYFDDMVFVTHAANCAEWMPMTKRFHRCASNQMFDVYFWISQKIDACSIWKYIQLWNKIDATSDGHRLQFLVQYRHNCIANTQFLRWNVQAFDDAALLNLVHIVKIDGRNSRKTTENSYIIIQLIGDQITAKYNWSKLRSNIDTTLIADTTLDVLFNAWKKWIRRLI